MQALHWYFAICIIIIEKTIVNISYVIVETWNVVIQALDALGKTRLTNI